MFEHDVLQKYVSVICSTGQNMVKALSKIGHEHKLGCNTENMVNL